MGLEAASFISQLVNSNPTGADDYATADDHIRLIKAVLQLQFPNFAAAAMNATVAELNKLVGYTGNGADLSILAGAAAAGLTSTELLFLNGVTSAIQTQLNAKAAAAHSHTSGEISALDVSDITTGIFAAAFIPNLNASKITAGVFAAARIATHTGDVVGQAALTIDPTAISGKSLVSGVAGDMLLLWDATDALLKRANVSDFLATGEVNDLTAAVVWANIPNVNVPVGAVTQHEGAINHDALLGFVGAEHLDWTADLGGTNLHANNSANGALALTSGEVTQLAKINTTVISAADWVALTSLVSLLPAVKTDDEIVNNSATLQDDDHLSVSVAVNRHYKVEMYLEIDANNVAADFKFQFAGPAGSAGSMAYWVMLENNDIVTGNSAGRSNMFGINTIAVDNVTLHTFVKLTGSLETAGTAGTFKLTWAQSAATAADTTVIQRSLLILTDLGAA